MPAPPTMRHTFVAAATSAMLLNPVALAAVPVGKADVSRPAPPTARTGIRIDPRGATTTPAAPRPTVVPTEITGGRRAITADSVVIEKSLRRLTLYAGGMPLRTYDVALGANPVGPKVRAGDFRTPEGLYSIDARNPVSRYHKGLHISYPNAADLARAQATGERAGGDIMIHGLPNEDTTMAATHRSSDWTNGCIAVTNEEIDEIWASVPVGTPVRIKP